MKISGHIIDIEAKRIFDGTIEVHYGRITGIHGGQNVPDQFILPGFVDAHVHIESSMIVPSEFARMAVVHGTVATISDPHEIANVMGIAGVDFMINSGNKVPFKFFFGAPSCVPATSFETAGSTIDVEGVEALLGRREIKYLAEMMNWPGVLAGDSQVLAKIAIARALGKVVDGHAPGLMGDRARQYAACGITTDHECFTSEEALDKLACGMKILIREGSAARNFEALAPLLHDHSDNMMFCSDDKHPDSLEEGHINELVKRALARGIDLFKVLRAACINPVRHYNLDVGTLAFGEHADFIVVNNLTEFRILETYVGGHCVASGGRSMINSVDNDVVNKFVARKIEVADLQLPATGSQVRVIEAHDGQLITTQSFHACKTENGFAVSDPTRDVLKIAVVNRYKNEKPAIAFVKNFYLREGAIASSVAHDSHNIIVVGTSDELMTQAVNLIMEAKGGVSAVARNQEMVIPLPVAGLMSTADGYTVAAQYKGIDRMAKQMGSTLGSPFMTLSFMALLVIPSLKLSDKGLFDGDTFQFTGVFIP